MTAMGRPSSADTRCGKASRNPTGPVLSESTPLSLDCRVSRGMWDAWGAAGASEGESGGGSGGGGGGEGGGCGGARWGVGGVVWRGGMPVRLHVGVEAEVGVVGAVVVVVGVVGVGMVVGGH